MWWRRRTRFDEEFESHLAEETADNIARGMDPAAARDAASRTFGNVEAAKETLRERDRMYWVDTLFQDIRFAFRLIGRNRWLSATIVATLTIGISLNVTVFSLLNGFLLRPWVRSQPETLISVFAKYSGEYQLRYSDGGMSQPDYARYRDSAKSLAALSAYRLLNVSLSGAEAGSIRAGLVSCNVVDVVRPAPPLVGRYLAPDECDMANPSLVAVLSESAWRIRFNADPHVIGRTIHLNRLPFTVVGVARTLTLPGETTSAMCGYRTRCSASCGHLTTTSPIRERSGSSSLAAGNLTSRCGGWNRSCGCSHRARTRRYRAGRHLSS